MANAMLDARQEGEPYRRVEVRVSAGRDDGTRWAFSAGYSRLWQCQVAAVVVRKASSLVPIQLGGEGDGETAGESERSSAA